MYSSVEAPGGRLQGKVVWAHHFYLRTYLAGHGKENLYQPRVGVYADWKIHGSLQRNHGNTR